MTPDRFDLQPNSPVPRRIPRRVPRLDQVGILRPLSNRDFALLWTGRAISLIGDGVFFVAIAFLIYSISNRPSALSWFGFVWTGVTTLLLVFAGVAGDRLERRSLMLWSDAIRAIAVCLMGALVIAGDVQMWHLLLLGAIYGVGTAFFHPAFDGIVPQIVPTEQLVQANSLGQFVEPLTLRFVGPALGGLIVYKVGAGWALILDGITYIVSALCIAAMTRMPTPANGEGGAGVFADIVEGFRFVRSKVWLWVSFLSAAIGLLAFMGPWEVLLPYIVKNDLGGNAGTYGLIVAVGGVAGIIGSVVIGQRGLPRRHVFWLYMFWGICLFAVAGYAFVNNVGQAMVVSAVIGLTLALASVIWMTMMHRLVPPHLLSRVTAFDWLVSGGLIPLSFALTGPAAARFGVRPTLIGAGVIAGAATFAVMFVPGMFDTERDGSMDLDPVVEAPVPVV